MQKKIFSVISIIFLTVSVIFPSLTASAYEVTGFNISAKAGMLVSLDTGEVLYSNNTEAKMYPASLTKIMTVTLMLESDKYNPDGKVAMTNEVQKLISGTGSAVKLYKADNDTGTAQRTAIGQRSDGTVIMLVTDGRSVDSIGATRNDVIELMVANGAVNAAMLDGGSSAMMYYRDYYDVYGMDKSQLDKYQLQGLVNRYKAFTSPRRIPTYFVVSKEQ